MGEGRTDEGRTTALHSSRLAGPEEEPLPPIAQSGRRKLTEVTTFLHR
jgi:hypothetical protein